MDGQQIQSDSAADSLTTTGTPATVVARAQSHKMLLVAFILASLVLAVVSLAVGSRSIPPEEAIAALHGAGEQDIRDIVWNLRMPRTFWLISPARPLLWQVCWRNRGPETR